ncbi:hypothetical protein [Mycobacterium sp.]|uniref:hypothetical protein n=1 Tax=Mycobacterium sp. TaxID=1785 RepID=UPI0026093440|nr:hypothetical protein [Mycobacterium sp.]
MDGWPAAADGRATARRRSGRAGRYRFRPIGQSRSTDDHHTRPPMSGLNYERRRPVRPPEPPATTRFSRAPSAEQLDALRALCASAGERYAAPRTAADARRKIKTLRALAGRRGSR